MDMKSKPKIGISLLIFIFIVIFLLNGSVLIAQISINEDNSTPDQSAMLDVKSTNKGFLFPRLSQEQLNTIPSPATGLLIFNTTTNLFNYYNGSYWFQIEATFLSSNTGTVRPGGGIAISEFYSINPDSSAMLDVNDNARGVLIPRTTADLIASPAEGLIIYNISTNRLNYYDGSQWTTLCDTSTLISAGTGTQELIGVSINMAASPPHQSAILDVTSSNKGILVPRMTESQKNSILPAAGLTIYNTTSHSIEFFNGLGWYKLNSNFIAAPVAGTHVASATQIIWNWLSVSGATGYKWHTINDYSTAIDLGMATTYTETGLVIDSTYTRYVWAYNNCGVSVSTTLTMTLIYIGAIFNGGICFYIDGTGQHGMIAKASNEVNSPWGCHMSWLGATYTAIGLGGFNTTLISNSCPDPENIIAANVCLSNGWFLPDKDELNLMCWMSTLLGMSSGLYFSSTEIDLQAAWGQFAGGGMQGPAVKYAYYKVRCLKYF